MRLLSCFACACGGGKGVSEKQGVNIDWSRFNESLELPYSLRLVDFQIAMQDVYDLFRDINGLLLDRGLNRLEETFRPAAMSGYVSDLLTASLSNHARPMVVCLCLSS